MFCATHTRLYSLQDAATGNSIAKAARDADAIYKERYATCGVGKKADKNRPLGFCDRVLYRAGVNSAECAYHMVPTYETYKSVLLCPASDHNAVIADISVTWAA